MDINKYPLGTVMKNVSISYMKKSGFIEVVVTAPPSNIYVKLILFFLGLFSLVVPIFILFMDFLDIGFGYIITLAIFLGSSVFFFRKLLWSHYGKEIYSISENKFSFFYDYGLFRDNSTELKYDSLEVGYCELDEPNELNRIIDPDIDSNFQCYLGFIVDSEALSSNIPVSFDYVKELLDLVNESQKLKTGN